MDWTEEAERKNRLWKQEPGAGSKAKTIVYFRKKQFVSWGPQTTLRKNEAPKEEVVSSVFMGQKPGDLRKPSCEPNRAFWWPIGQDIHSGWRRDYFFLITSPSNFFPHLQAWSLLLKQGQDRRERISLFSFCLNTIKGIWKENGFIPLNPPVWGKYWETDSTKQCLKPKSFIFTFWGCHKCKDYTR